MFLTDVCSSSRLKSSSSGVNSDTLRSEKLVFIESSNLRTKGSVAPDEIRLISWYWHCDLRSRATSSIRSSELANPRCERSIEVTVELTCSALQSFLADVVENLQPRSRRVVTLLSLATS